MNKDTLNKMLLEFVGFKEDTIISYPVFEDMDEHTVYYLPNVDQWLLPIEVPYFPGDINAIQKWLLPLVDAYDMHYPTPLLDKPGWHCCIWKDGEPYCVANNKSEAYTWCLAFERMINPNWWKEVNNV